MFSFSFRNVSFRIANEFVIAICVFILPSCRLYVVVVANVWGFGSRPRLFDVVGRGWEEGV